MRLKWIVLRTLAVALVLGIASFGLPERSTTSSAASGLGITAPTANATSVPLYQKFELTFNVNNTVATNLQIPYDPAPPAGLTPRIGISVQALFLPPGQTNWSQAVVQPGFLYQGYQRQQLAGQEWLYPSGTPVWKIRFAPKIQGTWQYQIQAQDASICAPGVNPCTNWVSTGIYSFGANAATPGSHGFVQDSPTDSRYMNFTDGTPFVGLGINTSFSQPNLTYDATNQLSTYTANGMQLLRVWMDSSDIAGSSWGPWAWFNGPEYGAYMYDPGLWIDPGVSAAGYDYDFDLTQGVVSTTRNCIFNGFTQGLIGVKPNTTYSISVTVQAADITGPRVTSNPNYGFTIKQGPWPTTCPDDLSSYPNLVPYLKASTSVDQFGNFTTLQGTFTTTSSQNYLNYLFLMLDNVKTGQAHVTQVTLQEALTGGSLGPNLLPKSQGNIDQDFNLQRSWDWDYVLDQAAQQNVYFKLVTMEKDDRVWDFIDNNGAMDSNGGTNNFYAAEGTKVRQLQYYYYRYLAARWGYSTAVQSWEVDNESDPYNGLDYEQVNALAGFSHQWDPNHLVTMSYWSSYPASQLWSNASYPNPGYADIHAYTNTGPLTTSECDDANLYTSYSQYVHSFAVPKPTIRGETGINGSPGIEDANLANDKHGVWIHNLTWAQLGSGGMYDLEWWIDDIISNNLYFQYAPVYNFLSAIPLTNGRYVDAQPQVSASTVRVVGQKDIADGLGHFWIQNVNHNWCNVVNNVGWGQLSGTVTVPGFAPNHSYPVAWWEFDTAGNLTIVNATSTTDGSGNLVLNLASLPSTVTDTAVKIGNYSQAFSQQLSPIVK